MTRSLVDKVQDRAQRARILRKIMVSLCIGTLAYLITNTLAADENNLFGITLSVFIGGVTLVTQVLVDFESRLVAVEDSQQWHARHTADLVRDGFSKVNDATALFGRVEASAVHTDVVVDLIHNSTRLHPSSPDLVFNLAHSELDRTARFLKELAEGGNVTYDGEDRDWMLALARHVRYTIDATSLSTVDAGGRGSVDGGLWTNDLGQRYLQAQRDAVDRGVRIRRVFIMDQPGLADDPGFLAVCRHQRRLGIQVRIFDSTGPTELHTGSLFDFVLFDDVISYEVASGSRIQATDRPTIVNTRLELRPERVRDRADRFADLWAAARELDPARDGDGQPVKT